MQGTIKRITDKGFRFIDSDAKQEYFIHTQRKIARGKQLRVSYFLAKLRHVRKMKVILQDIPSVRRMINKNAYEVHKAIQRRRLARLIQRTKTVDALMKLNLAAGVDVEIKL